MKTEGQQQVLTVSLAETALLQATYEADMAKPDASTLPPGWRLETGYLTL